jgi:uncharacterized membrane protein YtjA (UPF0391 family)
MLDLAVIFLIIALVAAYFGFRDIASAATDIAQILFIIFLLLFGISLLFGLGVI